MVKLLILYTKHTVIIENSNGLYKAYFHFTYVLELLEIK